MSRTCGGQRIQPSVSRFRRAGQTEWQARGPEALWLTLAGATLASRRSRGRRRSLYVSSRLPRPTSNLCVLRWGVQALQCSEGGVLRLLFHAGYCHLGAQPEFGGQDEVNLT